MISNHPQPPVSGHLRLSRRDGETIRIRHAGEELVITVDRGHGRRVVVDFRGPRSFVVVRGELDTTTAPAA